MPVVICQRGGCSTAARGGVVQPQREGRKKGEKLPLGIMWVSIWGITLKPSAPYCSSVKGVFQSQRESLTPLGMMDVQLRDHLKTLGYMLQ